jgi:osmotically-inducible protein OsmY
MVDTQRAAAAEEYAPEAHEPAGYRHSDASIKQEIRRQLVQDDRLDDSAIEIEVRDGEVTISGRVRHYADMQRVEQLACATEGVKLVRNRLAADEPPPLAVDAKQPVGAAPKMGKPGYER